MIIYEKNVLLKYLRI